MKSSSKKWGQREFEEARLATRIAYLAAEEILIPASSYFQSSLCRKIIDEYKDLFMEGDIYLVAKANSFDEYFEKQLGEYKSNSDHYQTYYTLLGKRNEYPPLRMRFKSATKDIVKGWNELIEKGKPAQIIQDLKLIININEFEHLWNLMPEKLGNLAFVVEHVRPLLFGEHYDVRRVNNTLHSILNQFYFKSYTDEYKADVITDLVYLEAPFKIRSYYRKGLSYKKIRSLLRQNNMLEELVSININKLLSMRYDPRWQNILFEGLKK